MKVIVCKGCGQKMHGVNNKGKPTCVTCWGLSPDNSVPIEVEIPDVLKCSYCGKEAKSSPNLAFIDSRKGTYYCGCRGWD